jgi:carotenoid cleavage dioxygenase
MERRDVLKGLGLASSALLLPHSAQARPWEENAAIDFKNAFQSNPQLTPLRGLAGQELQCERAQIQGKMPAQLRGMFYRNGPGLFERGGQRYQHWFDGDGMVHAWRFSDAGVSHHARFVETKKFRAESNANAFLVPALGTAIVPKMPIRSNDTVNTANTNVVRMNGQLLALWEGGSAHALDAESLATKGLVAWDDELAGMPFSAHPKIENDGTMWNFGSMEGKLVLYHISKQGKLVRHALFDAPAGAMVHDFAVSQKHIIFLLPPIYIDNEALSSGKSRAESMEWNASKGMQVLVVDKSDFAQRRLFELPAMMMFHVGNAWEENQVIYLDFVRSENLQNMSQAIPKRMRGENGYAQNSSPTLLKIDLNTGRLDVQERSEIVEFPSIDPRYVAQKNRYVFYIGSRQANLNGRLDGVMRLDLHRQTTDAYYFGDHVTLEEHILVPKPNSSKEGEAWLIGVGFDHQSQTSFSSVFDAQNLAAGPLAIAHLPYWTPFCFHGNFYS